MKPARCGTHAGSAPARPRAPAGRCALGSRPLAAPAPPALRECITAAGSCGRRARRNPAPCCKHLPSRLPPTPPPAQTPHGAGAGGSPAAGRRDRRCGRDGAADFCGPLPPAVQGQRRRRVAGIHRGHGGLRRQGDPAAVGPLRPAWPAWGGHAEGALLRLRLWPRQLLGQPARLLWPGCARAGE